MSVSSILNSKGLISKDWIDGLDNLGYVQSVTGGTAISVTGTPTNPIIGVQVNAGPGIAINPPLDFPTIENTGVITISTGPNLSLSGPIQTPTISYVGPLGTVTSVNAGTDISITGTATDPIINYTGSPGYVPSVSIQAAGTTALTTSNAYKTFIIISGTLENFTTSGLGVGDAGLLWYVKNGENTGGGADITVQHNGVNITGVTSILHKRTSSTNTAIQILYWNGTDLIMY